MLLFLRENLTRHLKTRMTTFIKTKFRKSDDQPNIDKYRVAPNITEYHIINLPYNHYSKIHENKAISSCRKCM